MLTDSLDGIKTHYGADREHWKATANLHGRTKYTRQPDNGKSSKNDSRPPDTGRALLRSRKSKSAGPEYEKSYRWKSNSCWLDSSLTAIFSSVSRDYASSMDPMFSKLPENHPLLDLRQLMYTRLETVSLPGYQEGGSVILSNQRDGFRQILMNTPGSNVKSLTAMQTLFVSVCIVRRSKVLIFPGMAV